MEVRPRSRRAPGRARRPARRRARGTRGSAPARCAAPSRAGGSRCGPCRRLRFGLSAACRAWRLSSRCRAEPSRPSRAGGQRDDDERGDATAARSQRLSAGDKRRRRSRRRLLAPARRRSSRPRRPLARLLGRSAIRGGDHGRQGTDAEPPTTTSESLAEALHDAYPELDAVAAAGERPGLPGRRRGARPPARPRARPTSTSSSRATPPALAGALGGRGGLAHERFGTAKVELDGHEIDIAARPHRELPAARGAAGGRAGADIEADLARRDFTINAMAIPLAASRGLIDPYGGRADLGAGLLRVLHDGSFVDDPTRALRAARYAARFGFELEPETESCSARPTWRRSRPIAARRSCCASRPKRARARGFELLAEWGLVGLRAGGSRAGGARSLSCSAAPPWRTRRPAIALCSPRRSARRRGEVDLAGGRARASLARRSRWPRRTTAVELVLARALGAEWLDRYLGEWREVALEIDGADLIAAGVPEGPALGRGLDAALRRKLDGEVERPRAGARGASPCEASRRERRWSGVSADGVRWLEADAAGAHGRRFTTRARRESASRPSTRSTSASSPRTIATPWSRTAAGSPRRSASRPIGSRSAARSTAPSSIATPAPSQPSPPSPTPRQRAIDEVDGHVVAAPGLAPLVFVADCVPVALAGPGGVAMLHCGWRGLAAGIVAQGAEAVGATDAAIGPSIGPCCYEVGEEVLAAFDDSAKASPRPHARSARGGAPLAGSRRASSGSRSAASARAVSPSSSSRTGATTAAPAARPAWSGAARRRADVPGLIHGLEPEKIAANLERARELAGPGVEILAACKYVPLEEMGALAEAGVSPGRREPPAGPRRQARALGRCLRVGLHRQPAEPQGQAAAAALPPDPLGRQRVGAGAARPPRRARDRGPGRGQRRRRGGQGGRRARPSWAPSSSAARCASPGLMTMPPFSRGPGGLAAPFRPPRRARRRARLDPPLDGNLAGLAGRGRGGGDDRPLGTALYV